MISLTIGIIIIILDQWLKYHVQSTLALNSGISFIPNLLEIRYIHNHGAGWGMLTGQRYLFIIITILAIIYILYIIYRNAHCHWLVRISYGLLLGGAIGNLIDRVINGYVIDMLNLLFINFPVFNIADAALTIGIIIIIIRIITNVDSEEII